MKCPSPKISCQSAGSNILPTKGACDAPRRELPRRGRATSRDRLHDSSVGSHVRTDTPKLRRHKRPVQTRSLELLVHVLCEIASGFRFRLARHQRRRDCLCSGDQLS